MNAKIWIDGKPVGFVTEVTASATAPLPHVNPLGELVSREILLDGATTSMHCNMASVDSDYLASLPKAKIKASMEYGHRPGWDPGMVEMDDVEFSQSGHGQAIELHAAAINLREPRCLFIRGLPWPKTPLRERRTAGWWDRRGPKVKR